MSTMDGSEQRGLGIERPCAVMLIVLSACLFLTQMYRRRRRDRQRVMEVERHLSREDSLATCWSTRVVYDGVRGDLVDHNRPMSHDAGERMHLLRDSSGILYT